MADKIQPLLDTSFGYVQAKRAFDTAITAARRSGMPDDEIAHVTGLTVPMIEAVAGKPLAPVGLRQTPPPCRSVAVEHLGEVVARWRTPL